jgi:PAT family beta-lactamase induction signal transducer AmpG
LAGSVSDLTGKPQFAWAVVFFVLAAMFATLSLYHRWVLPRPNSDQPHGEPGHAIESFFSVFVKFFEKDQIIVTLCFLLLYRFGESQLVKMATPFLLDTRDKGGLGISTQQVAVVYSTTGLLALIVGGIAGGYLVSRHGLKRWLWPMALCINLPHLAYVYLAYALPSNIFLIGCAVAVEQFGYGFGFTAFMMYMIMFADGEHKTAHYAVCTGFMALGMMLPGMMSGWIQEHLGYQHFFVWVCIAALPSLAVTAFLKIDPAFGRKAEK